MPHTEQEQRKKERSEIKDKIKVYEKEIKENEKQIKKENSKLDGFFTENFNIERNKKKLEKEKSIKKDKIKNYEERIKKIEKEILELKDVKFKKKDTTHLDQIQEKISKEIKQLLQDKKNITDKIEEEMQVQEKLEEKSKELVKASENIKNEIVGLIGSISSNILIKQKQLQLTELKLDIIKIAHQVQEQIKKIIELNIEEVTIEKTISENEKQVKKEIHKIYSNKKTEKDLEIAELDLKMKTKICEICELDAKLNTLEIKICNNDKEIAKSYINIRKLEISSEKLINENAELTNKKDELKQRKEVVMVTSLEDSIVASVAGDVNDNEQHKIQWWKRGFQFFKKQKRKFTLSQYQKEQKNLQEEITKLQSEKLKGFWNKFWLFVSCGCYNNHGKIERKIEKRKRKLVDLDQKINDLSNQTTIDPQPLTLGSVTNQQENWSDKILKSVKTLAENTSSFPEANGKITTDVVH